MEFAKLKSIQRHNLATLGQQPIAEISGSVGDLGTFLPILIALTTSHQISLPTTLIFTGIFNILTGCYFGIPLPVQPMKAIAAVALLKSFTAGQTQAAGLFVAACILFFSVTGLLWWFTSIIPIPVVKGIQVGAGLSLILSAGAKAMKELSWAGPSWNDNYLWVITAFVVLLISGRLPRIPYALLILILGLVLAAVELGGLAGDHGPGYQIWKPYTQVPDSEEWRVGIMDAGIGQLPLTTLNSIIAVVHLSADLLPETPTPSVTSIGLSVASMNLLGCWFGAMPVCHGSGGLAAQYRFGARSGASVIILGTLKLLLGIFLGETLVGLLRRFPVALLTVMVIAAGIELASVGESLNTRGARDVEKEPGEAERKKRWTTMLVTMGLLVAFKNDAVGFIAGMLCHWTYDFPEMLARGRRGGFGGRSFRETSHEQQSLLPQHD
jgi:MFS superfamily sulfate permease-like transporter